MQPNDEPRSRRPVSRGGAAKRDPETVFGSPLQLLESSLLSDAEKQEVLAGWEADARALLRAEGEGMAGEGPSRLKEVRAALAALQHRRAGRELAPLPRRAVPPGALLTPPTTTLPLAVRRRPGLRVALGALGILASIATVGLLAWLIWRTPEALVLGLVGGGFLGGVLWRPGRGLTSTVCTTCGGTGYVPAQDPDGGQTTAPCPICVPNDAKGG